ncbi:hypothetical protein [Terasakiella pusilla]
MRLTLYGFCHPSSGMRPDLREKADSEADLTPFRVREGAFLLV